MGHQNYSNYFYAINNPHVPPSAFSTYWVNSLQGEGGCSSSSYNEHCVEEENEMLQEKKRERWSHDQTSVLVKSWKEYFVQLESSKCNEFWRKIVLIVNRHGPEKDIKKCKEKIMYLKDKYKKSQRKQQKKQCCSRILSIL